MGLVPGVSSVFGADKPIDLGVKTSLDLFNTANTKMGITRVGNAASADKVTYLGSHPVDVSLSSGKVSSLFSEGKWKDDPITEDFQMKIHSDGTVEMTGILDRTRLDGYLSATDFSDVLAYTKTFNFLPEKVPFYLNGSASVVNNKVNLKLTSAKIGRLPLPTDSGSISAVEDFIERRISKISGMNIASLDFNSGELNFKGTFPSKMSF